MVNSCFSQIRCLGGSETSKSVILDGKQRCLGGPETSQSAILDGKQLFISIQVFRTLRDLNRLLAV